MQEIKEPSPEIIEMLCRFLDKRFTYEWDDIHVWYDNKEFGYTLNEHGFQTQREAQVNAAKNLYYMLEKKIKTYLFIEWYKDDLGGVIDKIISDADLPENYPYLNQPLKVNT